MEGYFKCEYFKVYESLVEYVYTSINTVRVVCQFKAIKSEKLKPKKKERKKNTSRVYV